MDAKQWVAALTKSGKPGPLMASLREGKQADIAERLHALKKYAEDAAVGDALLEIAQSPPWTSDSSKPLWKHVFELAALTKDPRLKEANPEWAVRPLMKSWLANGWKRAVAELPDRASLTPAQRKKLDAHQTPVQKVVGTKGTTDDSLLAAIYANPDDDNPRRVYADMLLEQGDPRGEFISLQLANAEPAKQKSLLKTHGKKWLGELIEVLGSGYEFRRGFLAKATFKFRNQADFEKWGERPEWSTLEEVDFAGRATVPDGQAQFIYAIAPVMKALRKAHGVERPAIVDVKEPWALEALKVQLEHAELQAIFESKMFPKLHTLELSSNRKVAAAFFKSLKRIGAVKHFIATSNMPAPAVEAASAQPFETLTLNDVVYRRDASGKLSNPDVVAQPKREGFPQFSWLDAVRARRDGSLVVVTNTEIWHVDASGKQVLNVTSRNLTSWKANWSNTAFTSDERVVGLCYKTVTITDPVSGEATLIKSPTVQDFYENQCLISDDDRFASVMGGTVVDLKRKEELKTPNGAGKARIISPDQKWWVLVSPLGDNRWQAELQRAGSRDKLPLEGAIDISRWSFAAGRLFGEANGELHSWDLATGKRIASVNAGSVQSFEAGGTLLTTRSEKLVRLHDAATLTVRGEWACDFASVSADGKSVWLAQVGGELDKKTLTLTASAF